MTRWLCHGAVVLVAVAAALVPLDPDVVERWYSTGVYPWLQAVLTPASNAVPFAWLDVLSAAGLVALAGLLVRDVRLARRSRRWSPILAGVSRVIAVGAVAYLVFLATWGLNYRRVPMADRLETGREAPSGDAVVALGVAAADHLNTLHAEAHAGGWTDAPWDDGAMRDAFARVQRMLSDGSPAVPGRLKASVYGHYFRLSGVDGMVNPFGLEIIGNPDLLPFERPFVTAHEWAHLAGFADESEASFVGWLTCVHAGGEPAYSGWLALYWLVRAELPAAERTRLANRLDPGPRGDFEAIAERLRRGRSPRLQEASWRVYDGYLRANRVEDGVRSYGAVVSLLLRVRFDDGWVPVRR